MFLVGVAIDESLSSLVVSLVNMPSFIKECLCCSTIVHVRELECHVFGKSNENLMC